MMPARSLSRFIVLSMVCLLLVPAIALAKSSNPEPLARMSASGSLVVWTTAANHETASLTVVGPDGTAFRKEFAAGSALSLRLIDLGGKFSDGSYTYEMRFVPRISPEVKMQLAAAREAGDDAAAARIQRDAGISTEMVQSGTFTVLNGAFLSPDVEEPASAPRQPVASSTGGTSTAAINAPRTIKPLDIVQADDVIIQGSLCVGLDCVNNESFGFDTIRLKENNTRIKFEDTSTGTGFPTHDWQLTANDSASGGAEKFSIEDITAATVPFTVRGSAPTNSIFVDSTGRLGLRTATPVLDIHVATSNTPALRLEQNNSGGFTAQTWDIAGNEANFFVRDVTGGSRLPFRIRPGAPTSSIDIASSGNVGIGTASPTNIQSNSPVLHIFGTGPSIRIQDSASGGDWNILARNGASTNLFRIFDNVSVVDRLVINTSGNVGIGTTTPTSKLQVVGLPAFANNAAAVAGGLSAGAFYRTGGDPDVVCVVH